MLMAFALALQETAPSSSLNLRIKTAGVVSGADGTERAPKGGALISHLSTHSLSGHQPSRCGYGENGSPGWDEANSVKSIFPAAAAAATAKRPHTALRLVASPPIVQGTQWLNELRIRRPGPSENASV